jgi:hypothetical protein
LKKLLDEILAICPLDMVRSVRPFSKREMLNVEFINGDYEALVNLNQKLKYSIHECKRTEC